MSLLEFPIRRHQFTLVAFLCLVALGLYSFVATPREEDPSFEVPAASIAIIMPGADPVELEQLVAKPLEDRLAALDDVLSLETTVNASTTR
jgi:multidrug efflux pump subunit AcrB